LVERRPAALWQHQGRFNLIDGDGVTILEDGIEAFSGLLVVVGDKAPQQLSSLLALLESVPDLRDHVRSATWIGGRRWNVWLAAGSGYTQPASVPGGDGAIEVRLPEQDAIEAWQRFGAYQDRYDIFNRDVSMIDMRLPDRVTVRRRTVLEVPAAKQEI